MDTDNHHHGDQPEFEEAQGFSYFQTFAYFFMQV